MVLDDTACVVKFALRTMKFYRHESCGWCIPCREGTDWLEKTLIRFHEGAGTKKDIDNIYYLSENMLGKVVHLSARGCGGDAGDGVRKKEIQKRVRRSSGWKTVPV